MTPERAATRSNEERGGGTSSRGRRTAFRVIAAVLAVSAVAFGVVTVAFGLVSEDQRIHAFHNTVVATLLLVLSAPPAIAAARAPERAAGPLLHMIVLTVAGLGTMLLALRLDVFTLPFVVIIPLLVTLRVPGTPLWPPGRPSVPLLVLVAAAAVPLVAYALGQADLQRIDHSSEHAEFNHWVETSFTTVTILLLGLGAALRPAPLRLAAWSAGTALAIMGAGSLLLRGYASVFDAPWGWAALAGGLVFVLGTEWEARRARPTRSG
jgi:hypothetical protein